MEPEFGSYDMTRKSTRAFIFKILHGPFYLLTIDSTSNQLGSKISIVYIILITSNQLGSKNSIVYQLK